MANALIHDCSLEFDLKAYLRKYNLDFINDDHFQMLDEDNNQRISIGIYDAYFGNVKLENDLEMTHLLPEKEKSTAELLKVLLKNPNVVIILLPSFFFMYCLFATDVLLPLITLELMKWDININLFSFWSNIFFRAYDLVKTMYK